MKESAWLAETPNRTWMLIFLDRRVTSRKAKLFACACFRRAKPKLMMWELQLVGIVERYADGLSTKDELQQAQEKSIRRRSRVAWLTITKNYRTAGDAACYAGDGQEESIQCALVRDVFGNPFRPVTVDHNWLAWNDHTIPKLAQAIYDDRAFDRLPILADALEEAGCANADMLNHCRQPGEHVRGCWIVDLLLGKS